MEERDYLELEPVKEPKKNGLFTHWICIGLLLSLLMPLILLACYPYIIYRSEEKNLDPLETSANLSWLHQNSYLLYHDLADKVNQTDASYLDLYLSVTPGLEWIFRSDAQELYDARNVEQMGITEETLEQLENEVDIWYLMNLTNNYRDIFDRIEANFPMMNAYYDYVIEDLESGERVSNCSENGIDVENQKFYISLIYDAQGNVTIGEVQGTQEDEIRRGMNDVLRQQKLALNMIDDSLSESVAGYLSENRLPKSCRIQYGISLETWAQIEEAGFYIDSLDGSYAWQRSSVYDIYQSPLEWILCVMLLILFLSGVLLPIRVPKEQRPWHKIFVLRLPVEVLFVAGVCWFAAINIMLRISFLQATGESYYGDFQLGALTEAFGFLAILLYAAYFFVWYCLGIASKAIFDLGIKDYMKERCLCYQVFPLCKRAFLYLKAKALGIYNDISHFDVTKNAHKLILKIVLVNAVVLFVIGSLWFSGMAISIVYSILLYVLLRKYISDLQKKYSILLAATNEIAEGNLNVSITEDLGVFEPFKPQIIRIQGGFKNAVEEEVKSQRMKAELITNVSHDLKTPLTAIITYINLLKEEDLTEAQRKEYLDTLERKSLRLKVLIEDLFEVSKANSQNVTLNIMDVDLLNLVKQVAFETSDKLQTGNLELRMNLPEEKWVLPLDSQKTYRIYENLFINISKYAMPGTRVYVDALRKENQFMITLKNVTAQEITVSPEELTDRFVRGDASRNTEGSGLGLAIAKSFLALQGGSMEIQIDGDLFKVTTVWPLPVER